MAAESIKLVAKARKPGQMSDLYDDHDAPEDFADGVGQMLLGPSVTRIGFFNTKGFDQDADGTQFEVRVIETKVIMPTPALIEWAAGVILAVVENKDHMNQANQSTAKAIEDALAAIASAKKN